MSDIQQQKDQRAKDAQTFKGLTGREASDLNRTNPAEYSRLRSAAQGAGLIGAPGYRSPGLRISHYVDVNPPKSTAEIMSRIAWPEAEVRKFYTNAKNADPSYDLSKLAKDQPEKYASLRQAAMSYNIVERSETAPPRRPVDSQKPEGSTNPVTIGADLAKLTGLPAGTETNIEQLLDLMQFASQVAKAKQS